VIRNAITVIGDQQQLDIDALSQRIAVLTRMAEAEHSDQMAKSQELQGLSVETKVLRDETTRRRQDVIRLQNELEELKTDRFRLVELRRVLTDRLLRFQLENEALEIRFQQMKQLTDQSN
jgi:predicted nuclease with TOPRIM domain